MDDTFDKAYARYLAHLAKLDQTQDISAKNLLFRQLAQLLCDMESRLRSDSLLAEPDQSFHEGCSFSHWN